MALTKIDFNAGNISTPAVDYGSFGESFSKAIQSGLTARNDQLTSIRETDETISALFEESRDLAAVSGDLVTPQVIQAIERGSMQLQEVDNLYRR
jgi:hypothetical protein